MIVDTNPKVPGGVGQTSTTPIAFSRVSRSSMAEAEIRSIFSRHGKRAHRALDGLNDGPCVDRGPSAKF